MDMNAFLEQSGLTKEALTHNAWELIPSLSGAIFVLLSGSLFYMITRRLIEAGLKRTPMQRSLIRITVRTVYKCVYLYKCLITSKIKYIEGFIKFNCLWKVFRMSL